MTALMVHFDGHAVVAALGRYRKALLQYSDVECLRVAEDTHARVVGGTYWKNRTGKTAKSFGAGPRRRGAGHYVVSSNSPVAGFLDSGTRPHVIEASNAQSLRFVQGGSVRFAKRVHHPGTKALNYDAKESARAQPDLAAAAERAAQRAAELVGL